MADNNGAAARRAPAVDVTSAENVKYLKEQRVCERLEAMVRQVLMARPEDPVLAMCNHLNDVNRSGTSLRLSNANATAAATDRTRAPVRAVASASSSAAEQREAAVAATSTSGGVQAPRVTASPTSSRAAPFPSDSRRGSANAYSRGGSAALHHRLDRDESARSDVSAFSVTSVDMAEFLTDFRAAHFSIFGSMQSDMSLDDLADIVDRVALPIPDTRLLSDLFMEMDAVLGTGRVPFAAFLARMSFRIAGKYHADVVRALFFALAKASVSEDEAAEIEKRLDEAGGLAAVGQEDAAVRAAASPTTTLNTPPGQQISTAALSKGGPDASNTAAGSNGLTPAAGGASSSVGCTTINVRLQDLGDLALRGVGIRLSPTQTDELLAKIGCPAVDHVSAAISILDLARFLNTATLLMTTAANSAAGGHPASTSCSMQQVPSIGADLTDLAQAE